MVSRERLLRLGATVAERATERRVRVLAQLLLVAALVFVALKVRSIWHGGHVELAKVDWAALAGSFVLAAVGTAAGALIWLVILDGLGVKPRLRWAGLFFQAQLGKYIPGSIWQYAGRAAVARTNGIPSGRSACPSPSSSPRQQSPRARWQRFLSAGGARSILAAVAVLLVAGGRPARSRLPAYVTIRATLLYLPVWLLLGASFWLCARGLVAVPAGDLALYMGAFAVAWLAGLLAIYAPGGLGVREAVLVALLHGRIGAADALVVAAASRLMLILADVLLAAVSTAAIRGRPADSTSSTLPTTGDSSIANLING